jgi:transposase
MLSGAFRMSKREVQALLKALFSLDVSLGAVSGCEKAVAQALGPCLEEAVAHAQGQKRANVDETGWKQARRLAWLWTLVTPWVTVFKLHTKRSAGAMKELLGGFSGVLTSDRFGAYNAFKGRRQLCWAHLMRDFEAFRAMRGRPGWIGKQLQRRARKLFKLWHRVRDGTLSRRAFLKRLPYHRSRIQALLKEGADMPHGTGIRRTCRRILKAEAALWTFAEVKGVEPTNNAAERALRPAVLWRKGSFGTQSDRGRVFAESILTARATLKKQGRDLFGFLTQACQAALAGSKAPSLLPASGRQRP